MLVNENLTNFQKISWKWDNKMRNIEKYYDNTEIDLPHKNVAKFIEIESNVGNAIDLGCGVGRDTVYLIKNGLWPSFIRKRCKAKHWRICP